MTPFLLGLLLGILGTLAAIFFMIIGALIFSKDSPLDDYDDGEYSL